MQHLASSVSMVFFFCLLDLPGRRFAEALPNKSRLFLDRWLPFSGLADHGGCLDTSRWNDMECILRCGPGAGSGLLPARVRKQLVQGLQQACCTPTALSSHSLQKVAASAHCATAMVELRVRTCEVGMTTSPHLGETVSARAECGPACEEQQGAGRGEAFRSRWRAG